MNPQYILLFHHFRELLKRADGAGIPMMPLKGAHLLTSVYPPTEDRGPLADVDFLIRPADWDDVQNIMTERGFTPRPSTRCEDLSFEKGYYLDVGKGRRLLFELHRYISEPCRFHIDHDGIWDRAVPGTFEGAPCYRMAAEDVFCHVAWHGAVHRFICLSRVRRDLELIYNSGASLDRIVDRSREWGCTRVVWLFLRDLIRRYPGDHPVEDRLKVKRLAPPFPVGYLLDACLGTGPHTRLSHLHHRVQAAFLWPLVFDSSVGLARAVIRHPASPFFKSSAPKNPSQN